MDTRIIIETRAQMAELVRQLNASDKQDVQQGNKDKDEKRRGHWRMVFATPASIEMGGTEKQEPVYVTTRDINEDGIGFLCKRQMAAGQKIFITLDTDLGTAEITGTVCHCTATVGMYKVGVKFDLLEPERN